ncbi:glycosyltransferase [Treponema sp.]|uniref:glycosyltransferase n=1 Tax=Treponema sp. TaxID=166 RepID=UPI00388ED07A
MTVVLVIDSFDDLNNGTTASARRFVENLRKLGHTVRILTAGIPGPDKFILKKWKVPVVSFFADKQGITFARPDENVIRQAFTGADIIHFYLPFPMGRVAEKIAREMNIPCIAAFHVQAENITYNIGLGKFDFAARFFYKFLFKYFYNRFDDIHCPTQFIADELKKNGYKANLHVISNGVDEVFVPQKPVEHSKFNILMIGRLSPEKRQDLVIKAAGLSKYADKIQLHFAGQGPNAEKYKKMAKKLKNPAVFGFYTTEELLKIIAETDLYVHASDVEIEAIACMEAFSCGLVPVISNAKKSATVQFALDEKSLFKEGNAKSLAERIDWWIEHSEEKLSLSKKYIEEGEQYRVSTSVKKMEEVYKSIIEKYSKQG